MEKDSSAMWGGSVFDLVIIFQKDWAVGQSFATAESGASLQFCLWSRLHELLPLKGVDAAANKVRARPVLVRGTGKNKSSATPATFPVVAA